MEPAMRETFRKWARWGAIALGVSAMLWVLLVVVFFVWVAKTGLFH